MRLRPRSFPALLSAGALALALGLTGCPPSYPPGQCGLVMDAGFPADTVIYLDTDGDLLAPGALSVFTGKVSFGLCPPGYDYPAVREVAVTAPSGAEIPATWHRRSGKVAADFATSEEGEHVVSVTYEPDPAT